MSAVVWTLRLAGALAVAYGGLNLALLWNRRNYFKPACDPTQGGNLLVVVPHQDDETIVAAGWIKRTMGKGGQVFAAYTVDGVNHGKLTPEELERRVVKREQQALAALALNGVPAENVRFLRYENEQGLLQPESAVHAMEQIAERIRAVRPYALVTVAFEGGHIDHDMTNFIVSHAVKVTGFPVDRVFEAPTYNRYYLRQSIKNFLAKWVPVPVPNPPRFIPRGTPAWYLDMSPSEIEHKAKMFRIYDDWDPPELIREFGSPDQFRPLPNHDYKAGPYDRSKTLRHWFARMRYPGSREPYAFFRHLTGKDYAVFIPRIEAALAQVHRNPV